MLDLNKRKKPANRRIAPREDCKYWQASCDICGITGNDYCTSKCKDYDFDAYYLYEEEF